jgi:hypothetical protein
MNKLTNKKTISNIFFTCNKFNSKYSLQNKIAESSTANVYKIKCKKSKQKFALKAYNHRSFQGKVLISRKK